MLIGVKEQLFLFIFAEHCNRCYEMMFFREEMFKESLQKLKKEIVKANTLVREANSYAAEIAPKRTNYSVTLQIPAANLRPSKIKVDIENKK
jgi:hypothetical protein